MIKIIEGKLTAKGKKFGVVISRFNELISSQLFSGAQDCLVRHECKPEDITAAWVPGSFEIPLAAKKMAASGKYDAVICLGAVIRGETIHFDLVAQGVAQVIMQTSLESGKPIIFGVLAVDTVDQAYKRSEEKGDNKGRDAALAVIEMIDVLKQAARNK